MRTVVAVVRMASATPRSRIIGAMTSPAMRRRRRGHSAAPQPDAGRVDRLLAERAEAFALERRVAPADFAAGEELLEAVVDGARQDHPVEDLDPLLAGQRPSMAARRRKPSHASSSSSAAWRIRSTARGPRRGFRQVQWKRSRLQPAAELVTEYTSSRIDFGRRGSDSVGRDRLNRPEDVRQRKRIALDDEGCELAGDAGQAIEVDGHNTGPPESGHDCRRSVRLKADACITFMVARV